MPHIALIAQAIYLLGGLAGLFLVIRSPLTAALFWGTGIALHLGLAFAEMAALTGWHGLAGLEADLRYLAFTLGLTGLALGAAFSLIIPPGSSRMTLYSGIALAILIAVGADRLPIGTLPLPLILLGILMLAVLVGLRHRPVPAARYRYLGFIPVPPASLARACLGLALAAFGLTAFRAR
jgi:hypothetical protein